MQPPNTDRWVMQTEIRTTLWQAEPRTIRHPTAGLITRAALNFKYGRVSTKGKVHWFEYALIRWEVEPYPQVCFLYQCGPQSILVFPVQPDEIKSFELCARCFSFRSQEGRKKRREALDGF